MTSRSWCITSYTEPIPKNENPLRYYVYQTEKCPSTENIHWQIYAEFANPIRFKAAQTLLGVKNAHCEKRIGTREQARDYCMKLDTRLNASVQPVQWGSWAAGGQGTRTDLSGLLEMIKKGAKNIDIIEANPACYGQYRNTIKDYRFEVLKQQTKEQRKVKVEVHWGNAGVGKTHHALYNRGEDIFNINFNSTVWWDGYEGEKTLVIDEFYGNIPYHEILQVLQGHQLRLPIKCGHTWANWDTVIITSNEHPYKWYKGVKNTDALKDRFDVITQYVGQSKRRTTPTIETIIEV